MIKVGDIVRHEYLNGVFRVAKVSNLDAIAFDVSTELDITWGGNTIMSIPLKNIGAYTVPNIKKVIFSDPATIVIWEDDTKTVVKAGKNSKGKQEKYDPEKGLAMAICKKLFGTNESGSNYYDVFKKWLGE